MEINPTNTDDKQEISPIELQALLAERSSAEQVIMQKEQELLFAKQNLENINNRIAQSKDISTGTDSVVSSENTMQKASIDKTQDIGPTEQAPSINPELITPIANKPENMLSIGEKRYEMISMKISSVKESAKARISSASNKLGNFFKKIKDFGYELPKNIAVAVLSTDALAGKAGEKIEAGADFVANKIDQKIEAGMNVGEKILTKGTQGLDAGIKFVDDMYEKGLGAIEKGATNMSNFTVEKSKALVRFSQEKAVLAAAIIAYKAEKTKEGLNRIQDGIFNQFNRLNRFMTEAGNFASAEAKRIKMRLQNEVLAYKMKQLDKEISRDSMVAGNLEEAKQARLLAIKANVDKLMSLKQNLSSVMPATNNLEQAA